MDEREWRIEIVFPVPLSDDDLAEIAPAASPQAKCHFQRASRAAMSRQARNAMFYADSDLALKRLQMKAEQHDGVMVRVERWDPERTEWVIVDDSERAAGEHDTRRSSSSPGPLSVACCVILIVLCSFVFFYFVPGSTDTPNAGRHHDLGRALALTIVGTVVLLGFGWLRRRSR